MISSLMLAISLMAQQPNFSLIGETPPSFSLFDDEVKVEPKPKPQSKPKPTVKEKRWFYNVPYTDNRGTPWLISLYGYLNSDNRIEFNIEEQTLPTQDIFNGHIYQPYNNRYFR